MIAVVDRILEVARNALAGFVVGALVVVAAFWLGDHAPPLIARIRAARGSGRVKLN